ncbi:endo-1,4-beta-xylanase [Galbibacter pacificus]|uniref:endo-1,4-beta-xylanase n=1 Tax=Galbibacter pacificus TaxID=2996052 RepID=UPI002412853D|nr:endo-1,4-beta-xylanase [Galbibacter pacificus]
MKLIKTILIVCFTIFYVNAQETSLTLKEAFKGKFLIGTAMNAYQIMGKDTAATNIIKKQFNAIVAENCMKSERIHPREDKFDFSLADKFVQFGTDNNLVVTGHTLIWHSQAPDWFFVDDAGKMVSKETLIARMKNHIQTIVTRYKGKIKGWDVVNEAINDDGTYRSSKFYQIIGEDYIKLAFQFAREADPDAELYYNDYSMSIPAKRNGVVAMVKKLQKQGITIDAIGMQSHLGLDNPDIKDFEASLEAFSSLECKVMITEMDISILPFPDKNAGAEVTKSFEYKQQMDPYRESVPDSVTTAFEQRYLSFFKLFEKHKKAVTRVTLWGVTDANSWKNNWPVPGRKDYPLLFSRNYAPKPIVDKIIKQTLSE